MTRRLVRRPASLRCARLPVPILRIALSVVIAATTLLAWPHGSVATLTAPSAREMPLVAHAERRIDFDVQHYRIDLRFDDRASRISGSTTIQLASVRDGFDRVSLDAAALEVESVLQVESGAQLPFTIDAAAEKLHVVLDRSYATGETLTFSIAYSARPTRGLFFFRRGNGVPASPAQFWSQGQPEDNHHWFPCWDYPNDKATSEVLMTIDRRYTGLSNGALVATRENEDGTKTLHWVQNRPHSTYLVMVAGGEFAEVSSTWRGRPVTYIVPRSRTAAARRAFEKTPDMIEFFSRRIGYDYPWEKYSQIAIANFGFGGMENTSATTLTETVIASDLAAAAVSTEDLVAHELAHQWWGNTVTCRDWSHAWLNEGFATYFSMLWLEHSRGPSVFARQLARAGDEHLSSPASTRRPLVYNIYRRPFDLFFDGTIYPKGAWVLHMLRRELGDEAFWAGLRHYIEKHQYQAVTTEDFRRAMEESSGRDLAWFFDQWVYRPGYPDLDVTTSWNGSKRELEMRIVQKQASDGGAPFRASVDVAFDLPEGRRSARIRIDAAENVFRFELPSQPRKVQFDPANDLLDRTKVRAAARAAGA